ncbi:MAG TPA: MarR family transcriptional regulator [Acholeplasmataceae bacterium]|nr:MarR family transcriptional regulator [Acholeplasmataceae bacterium]
MLKAKDILNELLVNIFNYILNIESLNLKKQGVRLSMNEVHILEAIYNTDPPIMTNVARKLLITVGTLTTAIDRLVEKGYVERYQNEDDRRRVYLRLTEKGLKTKEIHDAFHEDMIENVIKDLKIDENTELLIALENIQNYFRDKYYARINK